MARRAIAVAAAALLGAVSAEGAPRSPGTSPTGDRIAFASCRPDGRDAAIAPAGAGPLHAQLEHAALFYSYAVGDAKRPGRVAFLPWPLLPIRR